MSTQNAVQTNTVSKKKINKFSEREKETETDLVRKTEMQKEIRQITC